jgi:ferredoxin-NADP reductase
MSYIVKVLEANFVTHDVKRFVVEKPDGYSYTPGQATDVAINLPEWSDKFRPFTFTSIPRWDHLEFMVKIYNDHPGVTKQLSRVNAGGELIINEPFGAINYKGPGVFIAGGSGITPFLSILRELQKTKQLRGNRLIYTNRTSQDVIMGPELQDMLKDDFINVYTRESVMGYLDRHIDRDFLIAVINDFSRYFYVCGPDKFVKDMERILTDLGANTEYLVIEK